MSIQTYKEEEMSTALAVSPQQAVARPVDRLADIQRMGNILAASGYFSDIKDMAQAAVKVMAGEELGISPVAAVMGIHIIKGKVTLSANLIAAQVRRHGYDYRHKQFDNKGCVLQFLGKKGDVLGESSFTEEDAKTAGVYSDMYKKFPRNMYYSRAMSNGAKWYCPEVTCGLPVYVPEELGANIDGEGNFMEAPAPEKSRGTKEASKAVAEEKIVQMRAGAQYSEISTQPEAPEKPEEGKTKAWKITMLQQTSTTKRALVELAGESGKSEYYRILGAHGYEHANEIPTVEIGRRFRDGLMERLADMRLEINGEDIP